METVSGGADHGDFFYLVFVQREQIFAVFQQHHPAFGEGAGKFVMPFRVGLARGQPPPGEISGSLEQPQDSCGLVVQHGLGHFPRLHGFSQRRPEKFGAGHFQILTPEGGSQGVVGPAPVADHNAVEAPLVFHDVVLDVAAGRCMNTVDLVITAHHHPRFRRPDHDLKGPQIKFLKGSFVNDAVSRRPADFLIVERQMFRTSGDPFGLAAPNIT